MANGFFQGGFAEGQQAAGDLALRERALDIDVQAQRDESLRKTRTELTNNSNAILKTVDDLIAEMKANNVPDERIVKTVQPLVVEAAQGLSMVGGNPQAAIDRVRAKITATPTGAQTAATAGQAKATQATAQAEALVESGVSSEAAKAAAGIAEPKRNIATVRLPQPDGSTIVMQRVTDDQGKLIAETELSRGFTTVVQPTELPAAKAFDVKQRTDSLRQGVQLIDEALALPEGSFGSVATVTRGLREITRVGGELARAGLPEDIVTPITKLAALGDRMITEAQQEGRLSPEVAQILNSDELTDAQILETRLAFLVANTLQPTGKLLKDTLNEAREIAQLSGLLTSEQTARERLKTIQNILRRSVEGIEGAAGARETPPKRLRFDPATEELTPVP